MLLPHSNEPALVVPQPPVPGAASVAQAELPHLSALASRDTIPYPRAPDHKSLVDHNTADRSLGRILGSTADCPLTARLHF